MGADSMEPWLISAIVAAVVLAVVVGFMIVALVVMIWMWRRGGGGGSGMAREDGLEGLGYSQVGPGKYVRKIQGTAMTFEELDEGWRWSLQLPRYNLMTLQIEEKGSGRAVEREFESGVAELDERFVLGSELQARISPLLGQPKVQRALLAVPNLCLRLSGDDLVIEDPGGAGRKAMGTGVDDELAHHEIVANVVNTLFGTLYTEAGTVFDEYR
jgi:hypothetical protein